MSQNARLFLSRIAYLPLKRQIVCEFSNDGNKRALRYSFFPKMHFTFPVASQQAFLDEMHSCGLKGYRFVFEHETATATGATFSDLKKLNNFLRETFNVSANLIEPQRQFLIERGWNYFDFFDFSSGEPQKIHSLDFPDTDLDFLAATLLQTARELLASERSTGIELIDNIALSRLLKIPLLDAQQVIASPQIFLENIFFASSRPVNFRSVPCGIKTPNIPGKAELDLSGMVCIMAALPHNNVGLESAQCDCCQISTKQGGLPAFSRVNVRFLREGFYFNSCSRSFAEEFHEKNPNKAAREQRKAEYFYDSYPVGPFSRNEEQFILLADARRLEKENSIKLMPEFSRAWFCSRHESALSREINSLKNLIASLENSLRSESAQVAARNGLMYSQALDSRPGFYYRKSLSKSAALLLSEIPRLISLPQSGFFDFSASIALECISAGILDDLSEQILVDSNARYLESSRKVLIDKSVIMSVSRRFSELYSLEKPFISAIKSV